ncbi:hypothetical protein GOP47_0026814 [Adiantum capillus-veneris]|nr:hypothetical protein GOP47_0026814 [Adiantum capillus-veneris]
MEGAARPSEERTPTESSELKAVVLVNNEASSSSSLGLAADEIKADDDASKSKQFDREVMLAKLNQDKVSSVIMAWESNLKAKSLHSIMHASLLLRRDLQIAKIEAREKAKKARAEAHLQQQEEKLEKKRAAYVERIQNEISKIGMRAKEERAHVDASFGEETLRVEEIAQRYRSFGRLPKKYSSCFRA